MGCCHAQESGCFKAGSNGGLQLETNIDFSKYNAFFVGEFHGVYGVSEVKLALIKYLNSKYGITDVFMETGLSTAWLYNRYLQTGDTSFFTSPVLSYAQKKPNRDFWKAVYVYNQALDRKITIHGMDFERMSFLKALKLLMPPGKEKPQEILPVLSYIDTVTIKKDNGDMHDKQHPGQQLNSIYDSVQQNIQRHRVVYAAYYGGNFKEVERIMFNDNTFANYAGRNKTMYKNVMKEIEDNNIKKFIVFSGLNHGNMSYQGWRSLCYLLMHTASLEQGLANIAMVCKNCYDWQLEPQYQHADFRGPSTYYSDTALMNDIYYSHYNAACNYTLIPSESVSNRKVNNFSHYLVLLKNQGEF